MPPPLRPSHRCRISISPKLVAMVSCSIFVSIITIFFSPRNWYVMIMLLYRDSTYDFAELCVQLIRGCNYSCVQLHIQFHNATKAIDLKQQSLHGLMKPKEWPLGYSCKLTLSLLVTLLHFICNELDLDTSIQFRKNDCVELGCWMEEWQHYHEHQHSFFVLRWGWCNYVASVSS